MVDSTCSQGKQSRCLLYNNALQDKVEEGQDPIYTHIYQGILCMHIPRDIDQLDTQYYLNNSDNQN